MSAFPVLLDVTQSIRTTNGTSHSIALPATVNAGDVLLVLFATDGQPVLTWDNTTAGAWTLLHDTKHAAICTLAAYWKVAAGTEDGLTLTIGLGATEQSVAQVLRFSGAASVECGVAVGTNGSLTPDSPALAPSWGEADTYWISAWGADDSAGISANPAGYTAGDVDTSSASGACTLGYATRTLRARSENPGSFTIDFSTEKVSQTYAISPSVREGTGTSVSNSEASAVPYILAEAAGVSISNSVVSAVGSFTIITYEGKSVSISTASAVGRAATAQKGSSGSGSVAYAVPGQVVARAGAAGGRGVAFAVGLALSAAAGVSYSSGSARAGGLAKAEGAGVSVSVSSTGIQSAVVVTGTGIARGQGFAGAVGHAIHNRTPVITGSPGGTTVVWTVHNEQIATARGYGYTSALGSAIVARAGFSIGVGSTTGAAVQYNPPPPGFVFANNAVSYLAENLAQNSSVLRIPVGTAGMFPVPGARERFVAYIEDGKQDPEIVYVTSNPLTGLMAIERGQEDTAAQTWQAGAIVIHSTSRDSLEWLATGGAAAIVLDNFNTELQTQAAAIAALRVIVGDLGQGTNENLNSLRRELEAAQAAILQQAQVYADMNFSFAQLRTEVTATLASNEATVISLMNTVANSEEAIATFRTEVMAELNGVNASILAETEARVTADEATAEQLTQLTAVVDTNTAQISLLATTLATDFEALAELITGLDVRVGDAEASIENEASARADADEALATQIATTEATLGTQIEAAVNAEALARATSEGALASDILDVSARAGDLEASVSIVSAAQADLLGNVSSYYTVQLGADGVFAGFNLAAGTNPLGEVYSNMTVRVGNFSILNNTDDPVLVVTGGITYIRNVVAEWAVIETAVVNNFVAAEANIGTAAIGRAAIQAAAVGSAEIDLLSVDVIHIKDAAVSDYAVAFTQSAITPPISDGVEHLLQSVIYNSTGGRIHVKFSAWMGTGSGPSTDAKLIIKRKNLTTLVEDVVFSDSMYFNIPTSGVTFVIFGRPFYEVIEYPPPGNYLYTLWMDIDALDGRSYSPYKRLLIIEEIKK